MKTLIAYDKWCLDTLETILTWLNEWLSISQRQVEWALILVYVFIGLVCWPRWTIIGLNFAIGLMVAVLMHGQMRIPEARRQILRNAPYSSLGRLIVQGLVLLIILLCFHPYAHVDRDDVAAIIRQLSWIVFQYSIHISNTGVRGRRQALSMAKLKEMFGTEWIPQPEMMPQ